MSEECNTGAVPTEAVKLDKGKRRYSLIMPETLGLLLPPTCEIVAGERVRMAILQMAVAAHAKTAINMVAALESAIEEIKKAATARGISALEVLTLAMEHGADKPEYGRNNWKKGMAWSRLIDAGMRHGVAVLRAEEEDRDSGNHHLGNMLANIHMLLGMMTLGTGVNDIF